MVHRAQSDLGTDHPLTLTARSDLASALGRAGDYLREDPLRDAVNGWIGRLFDRENVDRTVAELVASQEGFSGAPQGRETVKKRVADAEARLRRFQAAIASGVDPAALVNVINQAQAECAVARAELEGAPAPNVLTDAEVYAMVDSLGDVGAALSEAKPDRLADLYARVNVQVGYEPATHTADVTIQPLMRVNSARVRGRTRTLRPCSRTPSPIGGGVDAHLFRVRHLPRAARRRLMGALRRTACIAA